MSASLGGGVASFFCMSLFIGALSYANALVAQYYGAKELDKCPKVFTQGLLLCSAFIPSLFLLGYMVGKIFAFMGHDPELEVLEREYFYILLFASAIGLIKTCIASYFSGIGRTKILMFADTIGVAINIPLTYVLIFGVWEFPELGIAGAGYATIFASIVSLGIFMLFYFEKNHRKKFSVDQSFHIDRGILGRYVRLGFPSGIEMFLNVAAFNLFLLMFQAYGIAESASAAIVFNWDIVSFVPMIGLNVAIISLTGRFIGEGNLDKMHEVMKAGFMVGIGYSLILVVCFLVFRTNLVEMFISEGEYYADILSLASFMMVGLSCYVMADAVLIIAGGILRGAGDTRWLMWVSVSIHWIMLLIQYFVMKVWNLGPKVAWVVFVIMIIITALVYVGRLRNQAWQTPEALAKVMAEN
jgi:MATE family multidrug resistance protein